MSEPTPRPASPRSPRSRPTTPGENGNANAPATPGANPNPLNPPGLPPGALVGMPYPGQPPRPNISSMLFLTAFFFFMSGGNNFPPPDGGVMIGEDGQLVPRVTELDLARKKVEEYSALINGTASNWTEPAQPELLPSAIFPKRYDHSPTSGPFYRNITGFYRDAIVYPFDLISDHRESGTSYFHDIAMPNLNTSSWNDTKASELRGEWDWAGTTQLEMQLKERYISSGPGDYTPNENFTDWTWVKGSITLKTDSTPGMDDSKELEYEFYGVHYLPNGTYDLYALPDGRRVDIRNIPLIVQKEGYEHVRDIIMMELEKELKVQQDNLLLVDAKQDALTVTTCPLLLHLTVPTLPTGWTPQALESYEQELRDPTGLKWSMQSPPEYWQGIGLGGVAIADGCGWAMGFEGGKGIGVDSFWERSVNYAAFASAAQLLILLLLVRQMETTRTPSTLAKVSLWTIVIMGITDSWIFSAHVVMGIVSDNRTSLPVLIPGFLSLCTAIVFGPRYAVLLHRIQAPERVTTPAPVIAPPPGVVSSTPPTTPGTIPVTANTPTTPGSDGTTTRQSFIQFLAAHPTIKLLGAVAAVSFMLQVAFLPSIMPLFLFGIYSFWIPQIYRNARRGTTGAFDKTFIVGTSIARLALPLYVFVYPENIFFMKPKPWVWGLVLWQGLQILMMSAQERLGPAFFLPKRFAPSESYNYHPIFPPPDPENPSTLDPSTETTCSICMEEVDIHHTSPSESILGLGSRRSYAVAPCHHLFHTKCLAQWLAIKTICPLCKRSLPPL